MSNSNSNLNTAKNVKNDEFYTLYVDIEKEVESYIRHNPDVFRGKHVLLPCDDPEQSEFVHYFCTNFDRLGLVQLTSTSFSCDGYGKKFVKTREGSKHESLQTDGDFRSDEVTKLRDECDIIVTNPPFSLFRDFVQWSLSKQFLIMGSINGVLYADIFPLIISGKVRPGASFGIGCVFNTPEGSRRKLGNIAWYTNMIHGRCNDVLQLHTMDENFRRFPRLRNTHVYMSYDNYDAIEIPHTYAIPSDYDGVMGVPVSWLGRYNSEQFEILACTKRYQPAEAAYLKTRMYDRALQHNNDGTTQCGGKINDNAAILLDAPPPKFPYYTSETVPGKFLISLYKRILIRRK